MITDKDKGWLNTHYPGLRIGTESIEGIVEFEATFNQETRQFLTLQKDDVDQVGGLRLLVKFEIQIQERADKAISSLPGLIVKELSLSPDRHFNLKDKTACLCSPLEEDEFLNPEFNFQLFFEELIIPFLYAQTYYTQKNKWPWAEYAHGPTGILESYLICADPSKAKDCLQRLSSPFPILPSIKLALKNKTDLKGHYPCFCPKGDKIRRCHPEALAGLNMLRRDMQAQNLSIPL